MKKQFVIGLILLSLVLADQLDDLVDVNELNKFNISMKETLYSGYLPVNEDGSAQFFYMFVLSNLSKPVTLWLNGGPGCSSTQGMFQENGPLNFIHKTANLSENKYTWAGLSNMLYLESPIGVGFSYGNKTANQTDESTANYNLKALVAFFQRFNQFQGVDFFISGESYAGIYIPTLSDKIIDYNSGSKPFAIKLKGIMIGNGCTDVSECTYAAENFAQHRFSFFGGHNLISPQTYQATMDNLESCTMATNDQKCQKISDQVDKEFADQANINPYNVYGDCPFEDYILSDKTVLKKAKGVSVNKYLFDTTSDVRGGHLPPCGDDMGLYTYFRNLEFLKVIHVDTTKSSDWDVCTNFNYIRDDRASLYLYPKLIESGIRIWKFSGDIDSVVPITGTLYWINKFQNQYNLRTIVPWRPWFQTGDRDTQRQVGGNFWQIDGITFVSVRDAGHMVPTDKKQAAFELFEAFLNNQVLPAQ